MQKTLKTSTEFNGVGLHSGQDVLMRVLPAHVDTGIVFIRRDCPQNENRILARFDNVSDTTLNTRICNDFGHSVSTIEHLMAAFAGLGITNIHVEIDGPEIPVMDGSSLAFVEKFWDIGLEEQMAQPTVFRVKKPVQVTNDAGAMARLEPFEGFSMSVNIDFSDPAIGRQSLDLDMANGVFVRELANCRTFVRYGDVQNLQKNGLALGGGLDNAVVIDQGQVLNPDGFRRSDECVRHKMLDALGDLYLAGGAILGRYVGEKPGHHLTNLLLREAFAQGALEALSEVEALDYENRLPGFELEALDFRAA